MSVEGSIASMFGIKVRKIVLCFFIGVASLASYYLLRLSGVNDAVPIFDSGSYMGSIELSTLGEAVTSFPLFIEKDAESGMLFLSLNQNPLGSQDLEASGQEFSLFVYNGGQERDGKEQKAPPIVLSLKSGDVLLSAEKEKSSGIAGVLSDGQGGKIGRWAVTAIAESNVVLSDQEMEELRGYLTLKSDLQNVEAENNLQEVAVAQQKFEIEKLTNYITEGRTLRANADRLFAEKKAQLKSLYETRDAKLKQSRQLQEKFVLSQGLVGMGKLVALARESLDRENRWVESMNRSAIGDLNGELNEAVARGNRIVELKNLIAAERQRLSAGGARVGE